MSGSHYFLGISATTDTIQHQLDNLQKELSLKEYYKKVPNKEDFHITLLFLGDWEFKGKLWNRLQTELKDMKPFELTLTKLGYFGKPSMPRVLWAGLEDTDELFDLQFKIANEAVNFDFPLEKRPFRPHITLAKVFKSDKVLPSLESIEFPHNSWEVNSVNLYQVNPGKRPMYQTVSKISFSR